MNNNILNLIDIYIKQEKYSLVDFQLNILDEFDIESSICFNDNDKARANNNGNIRRNNIKSK